MVKKIFYINSEMEPFASVSNLANLSVEIPLGLQEKGNDVRCLMPKYGFISERKYILREVIRLKEILFDFDDFSYDCSAKSAFLPKSRLQVYFLENKEQFDDLNNFENKVNQNPMYKNVKVVDLSSKLADEGSVDAVLTFRNLHNWIGPQIDLIFSNAHKALKQNGILGVVEHRANPGTSLEDMRKTGYVTEEYAINIAQKHGFTLISKSEINANPKDTKDHPRGVWTLPPVLRLKEQDKEKYLNIGESDRMTLLFKKL